MTRGFVVAEDAQARAACTRRDGNQDEDRAQSESAGWCRRRRPGSAFSSLGPGPAPPMHPCSIRALISAVWPRRMWTIIPTAAGAWSRRPAPRALGGDGRRRGDRRRRRRVGSAVSAPCRRGAASRPSSASTSERGDAARARQITRASSTSWLAATWIGQGPALLGDDLVPVQLTLADEVHRAAAERGGQLEGVRRAGDGNVVPRCPGEARTRQRLAQHVEHWTRLPSARPWAVDWILPRRRSLRRSRRCRTSLHRPFVGRRTPRSCWSCPELALKYRKKLHAPAGTSKTSWPSSTSARAAAAAKPAPPGRRDPPAASVPALVRAGPGRSVMLPMPTCVISSAETHPVLRSCRVCSAASDASFRHDGEATRAEQPLRDGSTCRPRAEAALSPPG